MVWSKKHVPFQFQQVSHMSVALQELLVILFQLLIATTEGSLMQDVSGDHLERALRQLHSPKTWDRSKPIQLKKSRGLGWANEGYLTLMSSMSSILRYLSRLGLMALSYSTSEGKGWVFQLKPILANCALAELGYQSAFLEAHIHFDGLPLTMQGAAPELCHICCFINPSNYRYMYNIYIIYYIIK